jgi:hypothetical protein
VIDGEMITKQHLATVYPGPYELLDVPIRPRRVQLHVGN